MQALLFFRNMGSTVYAWLTRTSTAAVAAGSSLVLSMQSALSGTHPSVWQSSPNPSRLNLIHPGWYISCGDAVWPNSGSGTRGIALRLSGAVQHGRVIQRVSTASRSVLTIADSDGSAYVEMEAFNGDVSSVSVSSGLNLQAAFVTPPGSTIGARVSASGSISVPASTDTVLSFDTVDAQVGGLYAGGQPTRLTVPTGGAGWYVVCAGAALDATYGDTSARRIWLRVNGTTILAEQSGHSNTSGGGPERYLCTATALYLNAGDYVEAFVRHTSTTSPLSFTNLRMAALRVNTSLGVRVSRATTQSITGGAQTAISFGTVVRDDGGFFSVGTPTRVTVPAGGAGTYLFLGNMKWDAGGTNDSRGGRITRFLFGGSGTALVDSIEFSTTGHTDPAMFAAWLGALSDGDYVEWRAIPGSTATVAAGGAVFTLLRLQ